MSATFSLTAKRTALPLLLACALAAAASPDERPRARDLGIVVGAFETGEHNAITDVEGVKVGHTTVIEGDDIRRCYRLCLASETLRHIEGKYYEIQSGVISINNYTIPCI